MLLLTWNICDIQLFAKRLLYWRRELKKRSNTLNCMRVSLFIRYLLERSFLLVCRSGNEVSYFVGLTGCEMNYQFNTRVSKFSF